MLLALGLVAASQPPSSAPLTAEDGQRLSEKLSQVVGHDAVGSAVPQTVVLPSHEVNAYLKFQGAPLLPTGVTDPHLSFRETGGVAARAIVNLDAVAQSHERGIFDPLFYLQGDLEVTAQGRLETADGLGQVMIDSATVGRLPVPRSVLNELVRFYSRSDARPEGVDLAEPFELPYGIDEVAIDLDQVTVVQ